MASFCVVVTSPSLDSQGSYSAYRFIQAALLSGHHVNGVFFYQSGVSVSSGLQTPLGDERNELLGWQQLASQHQIPLLVCVTAANRRGILSSEDTQKIADSDANLAKGFEAVGIGELVTLLESSDRSVQF